MPCDYQKVFQRIDDGDWDGAHQMVQVHSDRYSCLIHGYLHWDEGDLGNSAYWYRRAGKMDCVDREPTAELQAIKAELGG